MIQGLGVQDEGISGDQFRPMKQKIEASLWVRVLQHRL